MRDDEKEPNSKHWKKQKPYKKTEERNERRKERGNKKRKEREMMKEE